jgi:hypothetical protein
LPLLLLCDCTEGDMLVEFFHHFHFSFLGTLSLCDVSPTFKVSLVLSSALGYSVFHLSHEKLQHLHYLQFRTLLSVPWGTQETWECIGNVCLLFDCLLLCLCMLSVCVCAHLCAYSSFWKLWAPVCLAHMRFCKRQSEDSIQSYYYLKGSGEEAQSSSELIIIRSSSKKAMTCPTLVDSHSHISLPCFALEFVCDNCSGFCFTTVMLVFYQYTFAEVYTHGCLTSNTIFLLIQGHLQPCTGWFLEHGVFLDPNPGMENSTAYTWQSHYLSLVMIAGCTNSHVTTHLSRTHFYCDC